MADIKWIKLAINIFDNRKIKQIECLPDSDSIILAWIKLLCLAGNINDGGLVYFTKDIPYSDQMLAKQLNMNIVTMQLALKTFESFGMIDYENNLMHISNWDEYQNTVGMDKIREQTRKRVAEHRKRKKEQALLEQKEDVTLHVTLANATEEKEERRKKKEERRKEDKREKEEEYKNIISMYNMLCPSFNSIKTISDSRKEALKLFFKEYKIEDLETVFKRAEGSSFLKGSNDRSWKASFDWMIKVSNAEKILEGNYDDVNKSKSKSNTFNNYSMQQDYDFEDLEKKLLGNDQDFDEKRQQLQQKLKIKYGNN